MADRYQDRPFPRGDFGRSGDQQTSGTSENDPLLELARLIGQTDPFNPLTRANHKLQQPASGPERQRAPVDTHDEPATETPSSGPPSWLRRANRQVDAAQSPASEADSPRSLHPLHRYAAQQSSPAQEHEEQHYEEETAPAYQELEPQPDLSRYDDALFGQVDAGEQDYQREPAFADDPYAYQAEYQDEGVEEPVRKSRGGMVTVAAVLALAVIGTGAAFAYRTYVAAPRASEPPIIKADNSPTKIVPAPSDNSNKLADRVAAEGAEKIVPREESPVDINAKPGGPRVVFPPLNQNPTPPSTASVSSPSMPVTATAPAPSSGTLANGEPRRIRTVSVRGDQPDSAPAPAPAAPAAVTAKPAAAAKAASANASANPPMSLAPQPSQPSPPAETRVAATNPAQAVAPSTSSTGGYMVQVSSQRNEADAQASYRALQSKFPSVLGAHSPVIRRADLGDKGVYYRAMVGPFGTPDEASQFCGSLKSAGGQCVVQRN
jgi:SPOR domain